MQKHEEKLENQTSFEHIAEKTNQVIKKISTPNQKEVMKEEEQIDKQQ